MVIRLNENAAGPSHNFFQCDFLTVVGFEAEDLYFQAAANQIVFINKVIWDGIETFHLEGC